MSPFDFAVVHNGLGEVEATFRRLEEASLQRVFRLIELTLPMFAPWLPDSATVEDVRPGRGRFPTRPEGSTAG